MAHTYTPVTKSDNTYTSVSDVTPSKIEDQFTWANIAGWTWADLYDSGKTRWIDWYYAIAFVDAWVSITTPDKTYNSITKSDNSYSSMTTPSATYNEVTK